MVTNRRVEKSVFEELGVVQREELSMQSDYQAIPCFSSMRCEIGEQAGN